MLSCENFRNILCSTIFDTSLLTKLDKNSSAPNRISINEAATLKNLFETISNLWYILTKSNNLIIKKIKK